MRYRGCDDWGCGHFWASRGDRKHNGLDIETVPGEPVFCLNHGIVTKVGYPYSDDLSYRYVEITCAGVRWRYFYVDPIVNVGDEVDAYTQIGFDQHIAERYHRRDPDRHMINHTHLEVIGKDGEYINPEHLVSE